MTQNKKALTYESSIPTSIVPQNNNTFIILPFEVFAYKISPNAKLLLGLIKALSNKSGVCFASNNYFSNIFNVSKTSVSLWIKELIKEELIESEIKYKEGTKEILNRYLKIIKYPISENLNPPFKISSIPISENLKDNNISLIDKNINNKLFIEQKNKFQKPSIEEIKNYCIERNNQIDAQHFFDYYESINWQRGKNKIKDWKATIRTWEQNNKKTLTQKNKEIDGWSL